VIKDNGNNPKRRPRSLQGGSGIPAISVSIDAENLVRVVFGSPEGHDQPRRLEDYSAGGRIRAVRHRGVIESPSCKAVQVLGETGACRDRYPRRRRRGRGLRAWCAPALGLQVPKTMTLTNRAAAAAMPMASDEGGSCGEDWGGEGSAIGSSAGEGHCRRRPRQFCGQRTGPATSAHPKASKT